MTMAEQKESAAPSQLHQLTVQYVRDEDRMLLRMGTTAKVEVRVWLTRRLVLELWRLLAQAVATTAEVQAQSLGTVKRAMVALRHQEAVMESDFAQPHREGDQVHPASQAPLLVTGVERGPWRDGFFLLTLHTRAGADMHLNLNESTAHALSHLLAKATNRAGWSLEVKIGDPDAFAPRGASRIH